MPNNNQLFESNWSDKDRRDKDDKSNKEADQVMVTIPTTVDHESNLRGCIKTQSCIKGKSIKEHSAPSFKEVIAHKLGLKSYLFLYCIILFRHNLYKFNKPMNSLLTLKMR